MNRRPSNVFLAETLFNRRDMKAHTGSCTHVDDFNLKNGTTPTCIHVSALRTMTCSSAPSSVLSSLLMITKCLPNSQLQQTHERKVKGRVDELFGSAVTAF
jgi:hypothetical protein